MSVIIEALYLFDENSHCIFEHFYRARPPRAADLISRFNSHPAPQPAILYLTDLNPPTTVYTVRHSNLLFQCTSSTDTSSLAVIEFLHRVIDIFEDFLGSPLLATNIEEHYEVVAQVLAEVCDGGIVCNTEANTLKELVEVSTKLNRLFEQVGLPSASAVTGSSNLAGISKASSNATNAPAIPWRRPNIRHTSNELYVDIVESLSVIFAPSGRPISGRANGSIQFTSKISGVPDLMLVLSAPGGTSSARTSGLLRTMQLPSFHPCVRLARWKETPGELSFIPPDGKFMLAGYEVDLLPGSLNDDAAPFESDKFFLPALVDLRQTSSSTNNAFEAHLTLNTNFPGVVKPVAAQVSSRSISTPAVSFGAFSSSSGSSTAPVLEFVLVTIPFPSNIKNVTDLKASRGEAVFDMRTKIVEWRVPTGTKKEGSINGTATLSGNILGNTPAVDEDDAEIDAEGIGREKSLAGYYDDDLIRPDHGHAVEAASVTDDGGGAVATNGVTRPLSSIKSGGGKNRTMPNSISVSFSVKGWLPSGIRVSSLEVDAKKSRGLGEGVRPYKGVKYLCVSRKGVERRL